MSKKILILLGFLFLTIILLNTVSAVDMCWVEMGGSADCENNEYKVVMSISDSTNAHGALADQGTFVPVLCCNFGTGDTTCTDNNKIIALSSSTNAHAEAPDLISPNYATDVCYDSLKDCSSVDSGFSCGIGEIEVVYISNLINAHIEAVDSQNYESKICCVIEYPEICELTSATWESETVVEETNVDVIVNGTSCDGETISFEVFRGSDACDGEISGCTNPENVVFESGSTSVSGIWTANPSHDDKYSFVATVVANPDETVTSSTPDLLVLAECPYDPEPILCKGYTDEDDCNSNFCNINLQDSTPTTVDCEDPTMNCGCTWNITTSECAFSWTVESGGSEVGTCVYTQFTEDNCDDGFLTFDWTALWTWDDGCNPTCREENQALADQCKEGHRDTPCPAQIPLPFFNLYSLVATLIIIAMVYTIIILSKKKK